MESSILHTATNTPAATPFILDSRFQLIRRIGSLHESLKPYLPKFSARELACVGYPKFKCASLFESSRILNALIGMGGDNINLPKDMKQISRDLYLEIALCDLESKGPESIYNAVERAIPLSGYNKWSPHSNPDFAKRVDAVLVNVFTSLIEARSTWRTSEIGINIWCWYLYECKPIDEWELNMSRKIDFEYYNEIFRDAIGKNNNPLHDIYNDVPQHPDLMKFVQPFCIDSLLRACSEPKNNLWSLQFYSSNLKVYKPFACSQVSEFDLMLSKIEAATRQVADREIGKNYRILRDLKSHATMATRCSLPWETDVQSTNVLAVYGDRSGVLKLFKWHKITYGYATCEIKIFLAMLKDTDNWIHGKERTWTVSYDSTDRSVIVEVHNEVVKKFTPNPVVQFGLDLYMSKDGFGYSWRSKETSDCETIIREIADAGLRLLECTQQWADFISQIAELVPKTE